MITEQTKLLSDMGDDKLEIVDSCASKAPKGTFAEVGTRRGGTAILAIQQDNCELMICIDPYKSFPDQGGNPIAMDTNWFIEAYDALMATGKPFFFFKGTSKEFIERSENKHYAYVLLDGEHTNEAVTAELEYFSKRMLKGGIILVDNIDWLTLDFSGWEKPRYDMAYRRY